MAKQAKDYLDREQRLTTKKSFWTPQWQLVGEYVHQRRADFTTTRQPGAFINSHLWNDDAVHMAEASASAFLGYVWSAGSRSFKLVGNPQVFDKDKTMQEFWADATATLQAEMDDQEAGLSIAMDESMLDLITIGTDAIYIEERNQDDPQLGCLLFDSWSVQQFSLAEGSDGRANEFCRRREYSTRQLVEKYGIENVSAKVRDCYNKEKYDDMHQVLHVIEPRPEKDRKKGSKAAKDMPIASIHIEVETKKFLRVSGFQENRVACARLAKRINEEYGRGRAMNALPSIMMLNQVAEDYMLAMEKNLDPPMYQLNDAVSGNGYIDTSAGAINILKIDKAMGSVPPTGKIFDIQQPQNVHEVMDKLKETIGNHFMIDRLINLNNDVEMTKGEAFLRNSIRQSTLRSIVSRLLLEKFDPTINTGFSICLRRNKFGYMPGDPVAAQLEQAGRTVKYLPEKLIQAMQDGEDLYNIEYLTPAARDMLAEEGQGMVEMLGIVGEMAAFDETIKYRVDSDWTLHRLAEIKGADRRMWKKESDYKAAVALEQKARAQQHTAEMAQAASGVAKDVTQMQNAATP